MGVVLFVVEGTRWTEDDEMVLTKVKNSRLPCYLVINKVDKVEDKASLIDQIQMLSEKHEFDHIFPVSAKNGKQVDALRASSIIQRITLLIAPAALWQRKLSAKN